MSEPRIAEALLRGFIADPGLEEVILGDLAEERNDRAETSGTGPGHAWYWRQVLKSLPHLLHEWWLQLSPREVLRVLGRVALALILSMSLAGATLVGVFTAGGGLPGQPMEGDPHSLAIRMLLAGAVGAGAGGLFLAWRTSRAPMCPVAILGLAWIPVSLVPPVIFPSPGPPTWLLAVFPTLLPAFSVTCGAIATMLRGARGRNQDPLVESDPSTPEEAVKKTRIAFRLGARPLLAAVVLLMVPLVAMQFTAEVDWTLFDFAFMGALIFGAGFTYELAAMKTDDSAYRWAVGVALAAGFLLVWVTGAVGIIGSEANAANLMYAGVLAVGVSGAFVARFRPRGMARAMVAAAVAQALVALIAVVYGLGRPYSGAAELVLLNGFWVALFAVSARLFQNAAPQKAVAAAGLDSNARAAGRE